MGFIGLILYIHDPVLLTAVVVMQMMEWETPVPCHTGPLALRHRELCSCLCALFIRLPFLLLVLISLCHDRYCQKCSLCIICQSQYYIKLTPTQHPTPVRFFSLSVCCRTGHVDFSVSCLRCVSDFPVDSRYMTKCHYLIGLQLLMLFSPLAIL